MNASNITKYKLRKLLKYAMVTMLVAGMLVLFSNEPFGVIQVGWIFLGLWTGILEEFLFGRRFRSLAVPLQFIGKVLAVNALTVLMLWLAISLNGDKLTMFAEGPEAIGEVFVQKNFYRLLLRVFMVTSLALLVVQVEEFMGRRMFWGFLLGRYERPVSEERVMLTMDLQSSTGITERLGDLRYFRFLNMTHSLMTDAMLRNEADIHKYIGDEVIFTWTMKAGIRNQNCLDLYFDVQERIAMHQNDFMREFGAVPRFRAAVHGGRVITARTGHIKRAIDFSGDVMNSVSRMLGLCKDLDAGLLVSSDLLARIPDVQERFIIGPESVVPVKGRRKEVRVHAIQRKVPSE